MGSVSHYVTFSLYEIVSIPILRDLVSIFVISTRFPPFLWVALQYSLDDIRFSKSTTWPISMSCSLHPIQSNLHQSLYDGIRSRIRDIHLISNILMGRNPTFDGTYPVAQTNNMMICNAMSCSVIWSKSSHIAFTSNPFCSLDSSLDLPHFKGSDGYNCSNTARYIRQLFRWWTA